MINNFKEIYIEKKGEIIKTPLSFQNAKELMTYIEKICYSVGRRIDTSHPYCDSRLASGERVNAIIPPLSLSGPCLTIRKFNQRAVSEYHLLELGTLDMRILNYLKDIVRKRKNILISGGTSSGKTTLLNTLSSFISKSERIITIEDSAELLLQQDHVIRLETRTENIEGVGEVTIRDLLKNTLRMRPDRIIVGECRGKESLDMLQAMNTGHDGSLTTIHANSSLDSLKRLETLAMFADSQLTSKAIREQISSAINYVIQVKRLENGKRVIHEIQEINSLNERTQSFRSQDIVRYREKERDWVWS